MKKEEIAQWVIDNRYPKNELTKVSDHELYHALVQQIEIFAQQVAKEAAADGWDAGVAQVLKDISNGFLSNAKKVDIQSDADVFLAIGETITKFPAPDKTEYLNQKFGQPLPEPKQ
jgi:hypothetical protein